MARKAVPGAATLAEAVLIVPAPRAVRATIPPTTQFLAGVAAILTATASGAIAIHVATAPPPTNFCPYGEPHRPDATAAQAVPLIPFP